MIDKETNADRIRMKCMLIFIKRLVIQKFKEKNLIWKRGD